MAETRAWQHLTSIIRRLEDSDERVRQSACETLGRLGDRRAMEPLVRMLLDNSDWVREAACVSLGNLGDAKAVESLIRMLEDRFSNVREVACEALRLLGSAKATEHLIPRLADRNERVRRCACGALGQLGDRRAIESLLQCLKDRTLNQMAYEGLVAVVDIALPQSGDWLCCSCLARFEPKTFRPGSLPPVGIPCCRVCGKASSDIVVAGKVTAVIDAGMVDEVVCVDGVARVSWLKRHAVFDFDEVKIVKATEYDVERLCMQVGNDTDPFRRARYRKMPCVVDPMCRPSESALNLLKHVFGEVLVGEIRGSADSGR